MKIMVAVKRVIDPYVKVRVKADNTDVEKQNIKMSMNPFDEIALEEALRIKESGKASEVCLVAIGDEVCQETIRAGLALGADRGILVQTQTQYPSINIAKILKAIITRENPTLVLMGKQSIDGDNNQTGQMLAELLSWPQATFASQVTIEGDKAEVTREVDGGLETINVCLPAVITSDLRLNEPRYASLPNIMKAKKKPLDILSLEELGLELKEHIKRISVAPPAEREGGVMLGSVKELLDKLKNEEKVL